MSDARPEPPFRCSRASLLDGEPLAGTAPVERHWLLVEQPGPWEPKAAERSTLARPPGTADGARLQLLRRPGGGLAEPGGHRLFRADVHTGAVETARVADLADLGTLPATAWAPHAEPLWLVCTHGRRDVCCAESGRPVAAALAAARPGETWETSHLGGHRFAPTLLALPSGVVLGRIGPDAAVAAADALLAGSLPPAGGPGGAPGDVVRGRAGRSPAAQAAEHAHRAATGEWRLDAVRLVAEEPAAGATLVTLADAGGEKRWQVTSEAVARRQSCGSDDLKPAPLFHVEPA